MKKEERDKRDALMLKLLDVELNVVEIIMGLRRKQMSILLSMTFVLGLLHLGYILLFGVQASQNVFYLIFVILCFPLIILNLMAYRRFRHTKKDVSECRIFCDVVKECMEQWFEKKDENFVKCVENKLRTALGNKTANAMLEKMENYSK